MTLTRISGVERSKNPDLSRSIKILEPDFQVILETIKSPGWKISLARFNVNICITWSLVLF
jgi:hypothetical protein